MEEGKDQKLGKRSISVEMKWAGHGTIMEDHLWV